jgi:hypothetical protein
MLKESKFHELAEKDPELVHYYDRRDDGFYQVNAADEDRELLKTKFRKLGFSALNFTDSRSIYQFYNLSDLWHDIKLALDAGITLWHPATEPVSAGELYEYLTGRKFVNELDGVPADYDYRTVYGKIYGSGSAYIKNSMTVMEEIAEFIKQF